MYYGNSPMWETPLLEALRESSGELKPGVALAIPERVAFVLDRGADTSVGGYGGKDAVARNGLDEALSLSASYLQPALVDRLVQAARKPAAPLTSEPLSALLRAWSYLEARAQASKDSPAWDGLRASARATAERMVAAGVSLKYQNSAQGMKDNAIAPLSVPWLPDDLYLAWLKAGADQTDRSDGGTRINGVDQNDALPPVIMMQLGQQAKVKMLLEHDAALYRDPQRCGMAVADVLSWQLGNAGKAISPEMAGAISHVMQGAAKAGNCDMSMKARARPYIGVSADELPRSTRSDDWPELKARLAARIKTRTRDEWVERLEGTDACFAPVLSMAEAPEHPHLKARETFVQRDGHWQPNAAPRFSRTPSAVRAAPAAPGDHTREALGDWGLTPDEIGALLDGGVIAQRDPQGSA